MWARQNEADEPFQHPAWDYSGGSAPPAHSFTVRSHDELASFIPSGDRVMPRTPAVWALSVLKLRPFDRSQNRIVASSLALMSGGRREEVEEKGSGVII